MISTEFDTAVKLIDSLYHLRMTPLDHEEVISDFCESNRLHPIQRFFSPELLHKLIGDSNDSNCFYITDELEIHYILFRLLDVPVIAGPFIDHILNEKECLRLFSESSNSKEYLKNIQACRSTITQLTQQTALDIIWSVITVTDSGAEPRSVLEIGCSDIDCKLPEYQPDGLLRENYTGLIQERYRIERRFMDNIIAGNTHAAIINYRNMERDVAYLKQIDRLPSERVGAAIVRTVVRIASLEAGLPAITIDLLSTQNTVEVIHAKTAEEVRNALEKMIRSFCEAIRFQRDSRYSNLVLSAKQYIERAYTQEITVQLLADELNVSPNYLISEFHNEVGLTPANYLRKIRLEQALRLLVGTDISVQEVSYMVGIPDSNYFARIFKNEYKQTPTQYRKKHRL